MSLSKRKIRQYGWINKVNWLLILVYILLAFGTVLGVFVFPETAHNQTAQFYNTKWASEREMIIHEIREQGGGEDALRIAECESQYGKYLYNWEGESAKGVYMFIDKTWENYCEGDVLNYKDNIKCFLKLYPTHKHWWECI